jgi:hypothetical protein
MLGPQIRRRRKLTLFFLTTRSFCATASRNVIYSSRCWSTRCWSTSTTRRSMTGSKATRMRRRASCASGRRHPSAFLQRTCAISLTSARCSVSKRSSLATFYISFAMSGVCYTTDISSTACVPPTGSLALRRAQCNRVDGRLVDVAGSRSRRLGLERQRVVTCRDFRPRGGSGGGGGARQQVRMQDRGRGRDWRSRSPRAREQSRGRGAGGYSKEGGQRFQAGGAGEVKYAGGAGAPRQQQGNYKGPARHSRG